MINGHKALLQKLNDFCFGNGSIGVKDRLNTIENKSLGLEDCSAMTEIKKHKEWHKEMAGKRWEIYIGFLIVIVSQVLTRIF